MEDAGLTDDSKTLDGPAEKDEEKETGEELGKNEKTQFRGNAARLNYLSQDRSDIQFATKRICSGMAKPTEGGVRRIKRAVRYLVGARRLIWRMDMDDGGGGFYRMLCRLGLGWMQEVPEVDQRRHAGGGRYLRQIVEPLPEEQGTVLCGSGVLCHVGRFGGGIGAAGPRFGFGLLLEGAGLD